MHAPAGSTTEPKPLRARATLLLATLGIVYGDIGTSPLYAIKECFSPASPHNVPVNAGNVLGILSLIFWSLLMVVTVKYLTFVLRADNQGDGGLMALLALLEPHARDGSGAGRLLRPRAIAARLTCPARHRRTSRTAFSGRAGSIRAITRSGS